MTVLVASGAGVRHRRRWLIRDLDLRVEAGETVAIVGPPGSGRTSTLLALARRLRLTTGRVEGGPVALGHVPGVGEPEPVFTVREHLAERGALLGRPADVPLHGLDPGLRGRDLGPYQRQLLGLILASMAGPRVIALDDADAGLDRAERADLWRLLGGIAAGGVAVLVTAREVGPEAVDRVIRLTGDDGRAEIRTAAEYAEANAVGAR